MPKAEDWYKDIEGRKVVFETSYDMRFNGVVTGFDYYLGITIQAKDEPKLDDDEYIYCYRGPMTPLNGDPETWRAKRDKKHRSFMAKTAKAIRTGGIVTAMGTETPGGASAKTCPFSQ